VERAVVLCDKEWIDLDDFAPAGTSSLPLSGNSLLQTLSQSRSELPTLAELSNLYVGYVLRSVNGVKEKAARILDIDRKTLYRRALSGPETGQAARLDSTH
jgi:DNA-binding NtrC family response regulator